MRKQKIVQILVYNNELLALTNRGSIFTKTTLDENDKKFGIKWIWDEMDMPKNLKN